MLSQRDEKKSEQAENSLLKQCLISWCKENGIKPEELDYEVIIKSISTESTHDHSESINLPLTSSISLDLPILIQINQPFDLEYKNSDKINLITLNTDDEFQPIDISKKYQQQHKQKTINLNGTCLFFSKKPPNEKPDVVFNIYKNEILNFKCEIFFKIINFSKNIKLDLNNIFSSLISKGICRKEDDYIIYPISGIITYNKYISCTLNIKSEAPLDIEPKTPEVCSMM